MTVRDPAGPHSVWKAEGLLGEFGLAGVLDPVDVHAARRIARLVGESDETVILAAALALRGTRFGHVCVDLDTVRDTIAVDEAEAAVVDNLAWPGPGWVDQLALSSLTGTDDHHPLVLDGSLLYTQRMWDYQRRVADGLLERAHVDPSDPVGLDSILGQVFGGQSSLQVVAAAMAATRGLTVVAGGPGTGKTYTIARIIGSALEMAVAAGTRLPLIGVAAPTGKAAARLTEQLETFAGSGVLTEQASAAMAETKAQTIHRLLGWHWDRGRFGHDFLNPLPHDLVVIDEMSMVSLPMAAKVLDAVRPTARLVLVGDPDQLVSIEAGTVLADLVGPARHHLTFSEPGRTRLDRLVPGAITDPLPVGDDDAPGPENTSSPLADHVITLDRGFRFDPMSPVAELADAVRHGDADRVIDLLRTGGGGLSWLDPGERPVTEIGEVVDPLLDHARRLIAVAEAGETEEALRLVTESALLCAHRRGPLGVEQWVDLVERSTRGRDGGFGRWYPGRPVMVTTNDYRLSLFNGDIGVTVRDGDGLTVAFRDSPGVRTVGPAQLPSSEGVQAMTIHKSQGSQFNRVVVLVPHEDSRLLTRELLYTAVTRAETDVTVIGSERAIRDATERPVVRASGLRTRLWI